MYKKSTFILLLVVALVTACKDKKEEECVTPVIEQNIVGTWQVEMDLGPLGKEGWGMQTISPPYVQFDPRLNLTSGIFWIYGSACPVKEVHHAEKPNDSNGTLWWEVGNFSPHGDLYIGHDSPGTGFAITHSKWTVAA